MSKATPRIRTIKVPYLARVEGEGGLFVKLKGDQVTDVKLKIFEPPRLFEAFLRVDRSAIAMAPEVVRDPCVDLRRFARALLDRRASRSRAWGQSA